MATDSTPRVLLVGLLRVRDHCTFTWRRTEVGGERVVEVLGNHCLQCIADLRRRGIRLIEPNKSEAPG